MNGTSLLVTTGLLAVGAAAGWWGLLGVRAWRTAARLRRVLDGHAVLRADLQVRYGTICTRLTARPAWSEQQLADLEWVFTQIEHVLDRRRLEDLAAAGPFVPAAGSALGPSVLAACGSAALVAGVLIAP